MDNKGKYIDTQKNDEKIENKKRGAILYYSIDQVADLLNENSNNIKYYTNIFDDLLKIEIVDKELRYTNKDVDKLELLIRFKNRGMSLKEIHDYYNKLPLDDTEVQPLESNLISVEELIDSVKKEQQIQLNNFKTQLMNDIEKMNSLYLQSISSAIIEAQNQNLNEFKEELVTEIKEYINNNFNTIKEMNIDLNNKLIDKTTEFMNKKIDIKSEKLMDTLQNDFNEFTQSSLNSNERLIKEVKDFKRVISEAYYTQNQVDMDNMTSSFWYKLRQLFSFK